MQCMRCRVHYLARGSATVTSITGACACAVEPSKGETVRVSRTSIWGPCVNKLLVEELLCDKFSLEGGAAPADDVAGGASNHAAETAQSPLAYLGQKQAGSR